MAFALMFLSYGCLRGLGLRQTVILKVYLPRIFNSSAPTIFKFGLAPFPHSNAKIRSLNRHAKNGGTIGCGIGGVLLDGGIGGQSSYYNVDNYMDTTGRNPITGSINRTQRIQLKSGSGLADKIAEKLSKLKLDKPKKKKKNITMSF